MKREGGGGVRGRLRRESVRWGGEANEDHLHYRPHNTPPHTHTHTHTHTEHLVDKHTACIHTYTLTDTPCV